MSTLTKILIVLLTISSIFLCGIVVTYVANADNYRQKYNALRTERDAAIKSEESARSELNAYKDQADQQRQQLNNQIASLQTKLDQSQRNLQTAEVEKEDAIRRMNNWQSIVMDFSKTTDNQGLLLKNTLEELKKLEAEKVKKDKELEQITLALSEKMAIITTLTEKNKQLLEEKTELQNQFNRFLKQYGKVVTPPVPVTPERSVIRPAQPPTKDIELKGLVTAVDQKNSMAEISIGSAHGVKEDMKFHVTRGDEFICDILILDVDAEKAVGILDLVQKTPKAGDNVCTNL